jgi:hypothetical protein
MELVGKRTLKPYLILLLLLFTIIIIIIIIIIIGKTALDPISLLWIS